jgi:hypothetical protein
MMHNKRKVSVADVIDGVSDVSRTTIDCSPPSKKRLLFSYRKLPIHSRIETEIGTSDSLASTEVVVSSSKCNNSPNRSDSIKSSPPSEPIVSEMGDPMQCIQSDLGIVDKEDILTSSSDDDDSLTQGEDSTVVPTCTGCVLVPETDFAKEPQSTCALHPVNSSTVVADSVANDSCFVPRDIATTSPLSIKVTRRTVAPLKFDNSSLETDDGATDDSDNDDNDFVSISDTSESSSYSSVSDNAGPEKNNSRSCCRSHRRPSHYGRRKSNDSSGGIRFHSYVKVVNIPSRFAYTTKQKRRMWNGENAIRQNAKRNKVEYEWEGWQWQNVIEEDEFTLIDGQLIHPAHTMADPLI